MKLFKEFLFIFVLLFLSICGYLLIVNKTAVIETAQGAYTSLATTDARYLLKGVTVPSSSLYATTPTLLAEVTNVDLTTVASTTIFTSTGNCIVTLVVTRITSANTVTFDPQIVVGSNPVGVTPYNNFTNVTTILPKTPPAGATAALNKVIPSVYNSASPGEILTAGGKMIYNVTSGATASSLRATVDTFGFCY